MQLEQVGKIADLRGTKPSNARMLCRRRRALPKRRAKKVVALREVAVAAAGQGGRHVLATARSSLCLTAKSKSCDSRNPYVGLCYKYRREAASQASSM